ncbi:MAG: helix-turn-helix domain-containing protein [Candidatus Peribacteria bacterium]|nr:helix-turn-helix domain-containing protein [Candidatus Peribacteria bacterium]
MYISIFSASIIIITNYNVPYAVHPGEYLKMELEAREIKQKDFAEVLGISKEEVSFIINGKRNITPRLAARIGQAFGT